VHLPDPDGPTIPTSSPRVRHPDAVHRLVENRLGRSLPIGLHP
jgi:hypothetical protein